MLALSATYPESLAQHLSRYMREPTFVRLNQTDPGLLGQSAVLSDLLMHFFHVNTLSNLNWNSFCCSCVIFSPPGLKQYYKIVPSHSLPHKVFEEKVQSLLELFSKIPFNQALVFSNLHTRQELPQLQFLPLFWKYADVCDESNRFCYSTGHYYYSKTFINNRIVIFIESNERLTWAVVLQSSAPGWYPLL